MESLDNESKNSYIGSFLLPPGKMGSDLRPKKKTTIPTDTPAPNNQALVAALRTLQEKIHRLELERSQAEDDLNALSKEAAQYKRALQHESNEKDITHEEMTQERKDVSMQLGAAQTRCSLLEKQLDYMRRMVVSAEMEKKQVLEQQVRACLIFHMSMLCFTDLFLILFSFSFSKEKIKHLEQKLQEEQHQRKLIQDKAAQLQTGLEMNRILFSSFSPQKDTKKKNKKKKVAKKHPNLRKTHGSQPPQSTGMLPFVAGKSASSSHSVVANVQSVLHMMKYRSPCVTSHYPEGTSRKATLSRSVSCTTSSATDSLSDLLLIMQDELGQMSFEHQELLKQIQETQDQDIREDLERELDCLVKQMEVKGEQISKLKKHEEHVYKMRQRAQKLKRKVASAEPNHDELKETKETTVTRRTCCVNRGKCSLRLLKCAQKLQSVLKKDDIVWEP
ncbi:hypothetical protein JD844_024308 [Phrynosoma platyrhinos]|uniref:Centrosomal protein 57kDa-like protein 1 n=1 Tax=Phrynosoma platyrhinos TaxID=52577 RepID=A0ABQ7SXV7_PHRPL|nr:hypothetical protein JD844_024308 [Phrynosoma platyrhinos]